MAPLPIWPTALRRAWDLIDPDWSDLEPAAFLTARLLVDVLVA